MRKSVLPLIAAVAIGAAATPALANETRVEARTGVIWGGGDTEATAGVLTSNTKTAVGFSGRLGAALPIAKVYATGGYTTEFCNSCSGKWHAGLGTELPLGPMLYGKAEYRHYFADNNPSSNAVLAGIGVKF